MNSLLDFFYTLLTNELVTNHYRPLTSARSEVADALSAFKKGVGSSL